VVRVIPDVPAVHRQFDYAVPERFDAPLRVGSRVRMALHGRRVGGWVAAVGVTPPAGVALQPLTGVSGHGPPPAVVELAAWAAWRWAGPVTAFLRTASPERVVATLPHPPAPARPTAAGPGEPWITAALSGAPAGDDDGEPVLVRLPPAADPLPIVEAVLSGATGRPGTVLVLVPSVGWAARLAERLHRRGVPVARDWAQAAAGWPVVVGTRAAAWTPAPRLAAAVVLDAHDESYRSEGAPTWDALAVVVERCRRDGARCVAVTACPTTEQAATLPVVAAPRLVERGGWPVLRIVDRRGGDPRQGLFSDDLVTAARAVLSGAAGTPERARAGAGPTVPVVCVLNRTGRAKLLACASCGELARCERCGRAVADVGGRLVCPSCGTERPVVCAHCGGTKMKLLRPGVARVREELAALFGEPVAEVSGRPGDADETAADPLGPTGGTARLAVGTEAVLHRVRRASLVAFLDFDQHLMAPRYRAPDEALALLARAGRLVGGRAGDAGREAGPLDVGRRGPGAVLVQTRLPDHEVLRAALAGDPEVLSEAELVVREELALPPFAALATLSGAGAAALAVGLEAAGVVTAELAPERFLARAADHRALCDALVSVGRPREPVRVAVDPTDV
jgi:primosomal protein N' (replication factor Y)